MRSRLLVPLLAWLLLGGPGDANSRAGELKVFTIPSWGNGAPELQMELPAAFEMERRQGPDFDVFYFTEKSTHAEIALYLGTAPALKSEGLPATTVQREKGKIAGLEVEWLRWTERSTERSETLVNGIFGPAAAKASYGGLTLHLFLSARTKEHLTQLEQAADTLKLKQAK
jgi:hypothetical protein